MWAQVKRVLKKNGVFVTTASQPFTSALVMSNPKMFKYSLVWEKSMPSDVFMAKRKPLKYHEDILLFYEKQPTFNPILEERSDVGKARLKNNGTVLMGTGKSNISGFVHTGKRLSYDEDKINPKSVIKIGSVPNCNGTKLHPTQKPVTLMEYLIKTYTNEGETVLDFCMGSGTTGVACVHTGRHFIGIELDEKHFETAKRRIEETETLFQAVRL